MHTKPRPPVDPNDKYEKTDVTLPAARNLMIGLFILAIFGYVASYGYLKLLGGNNTTFYVGGADSFPVRTQDYATRKMPPAPYPLLQDSTTALSDVRNYRRNERIRMDSEGTDPATGKRFISVKSAIEIEAAKNGG